MDSKRTDENSNYLPKAGNPMNETVWYKIGGTYKAEKARYNDGSNLFVGRSLQEE